jgi:hypothetical protein
MPPESRISYTIAEHRRRHVHLPSGEQLAAFWRLPERMQAAAFAALAHETEREREGVIAG